MADNNTTTTQKVAELSVEQTQQRLRRLADEPLVGSRSMQLLRLAEDLGDEDAAGHWAEVDLQSSFDLSSQDEVAVNETKAVRTLEVVRNGLIFVPLLVTWYGLSQATKAYSAALDKRPDLVKTPFIALWEGGFAGQGGSVMRLSTVALIDVAAIAALIAVTVMVQIARNGSERRQLHAAAVVRDELSAALIDASLICSRAAYPSPDRFKAVLNETAKELHDLVDDLGQVVMSNAKVSDAVAKSASALAQAAKLVDGSMAASTQAATEVKQAVDGLPAPLSALGKSMSQLDQSLTGQSKWIQTSTDSLTATLTGLQRAAAVAESQLAAVGPALAQAQREQQRLVDGVGQTLASQQSMASDVSNAATSLAALHDQAVQSAAAAAAASQQALGASNQLATQISTSVGAISQMGAAQQQFADVLNRTHASVEFGAARLREDLEKLHAVLQWLDDIAGSGPVRR